MVHMAAGGYNTAAAHLQKACTLQGSHKPPPAQIRIRLPGETTLRTSYFLC